MVAASCWIAICLIASLLNGCATSTDNIDLAYTPTSRVPSVLRVSANTIQVKVADKRPSLAVGHKMNGYGIEMAPIMSNVDVAELVKGAIGNELGARGYAVGDGPTEIVADVDRFNSSFQMGVFSGSVDADLTMEVTVINSKHQRLFKRWIMAHGSNPNIQLATGNNAKVALEAALEAGMRQLFDDHLFLGVLDSMAAESIADMDDQRRATLTSDVKPTAP